MTVVHRSHSGYFQRAWEDLDVIVEAIRATVDVEYDTMIGTGLSGTLVVPSLARTLRKHWAIVRKPGDSSHASTLVEGDMGERWLFVDDFVSSGATLRRVQAAIEGLTMTDPADNWRRVPVPTVYVGTYQYEGGRCGTSAFMPG